MRKGGRDIWITDRNDLLDTCLWLFYSHSSCSMDADRMPGRTIARRYRKGSPRGQRYQRSKYPWFLPLPSVLWRGQPCLEDRLVHLRKNLATPTAIATHRSIRIAFGVIARPCRLSEGGWRYRRWPAVDALCVSNRSQRTASPTLGLYVGGGHL